MKTVFRYDPRQLKFRVFHILWQNGHVGDGNGYSAKLAFAIRPIIFRWEIESFGWRLILLGVDIHYLRTYGGIFV